jgi:hypothetical protein
VFLYNAAQEVDARSGQRIVQVGAKKLFVQKV